MAPRQKTFELVPDAPQGLGGLGQHQQQDQQPIFSKPPMTTKQAKKLHRQANKGPKLSKAEQRRIELMEQDRIRKEFEKEKQQARARTARERKKAKEEKEKEERRRKGLPMVDVHPSQDIISRFIMRGACKKRDSTGATARLDTLREEDTDTATEGGSGIDSGDVEDNEDEEEDVSDKENQQLAGESGDERTAKRPRLTQPEVKMPEVMNCASHHPHQVGAAAVIAQETGTEPYSRASSVDTDDPINETLLENQLIADVVLASSKKTSSGSPDERIMPSASTTCYESINVVESAASSKEPPPRVSAPKPQELQRNRPFVRNVHLPPNSESASTSKPRFGDAPFKKQASPYTPTGRQGPNAPAVRVPPIPPKFKSSATHQNQSCGERPKFLPKHLQTPQQRQQVLNYGSPAQVHVESSIPSSTQQYLLHHIDDILPSPSQEAAELLEVQIRLVAQEAGPAKRPVNAVERVTDTEVPLPHKFVNPSHFRFPPMPPPPSSDVDGPPDFPISTQELFMSSQEIRDIETPSKMKRSSLPRSLSQTAERKSPSPRVLEEHTYQFAKSFPPSEENRKDLKASIPTQILNRQEPCNVGPPRPANRNAARPREGADLVRSQGTTGPENHPSANLKGGHNSGGSVRNTPPDCEATKQGDCTRRSSSQESSAEQPRVTPRSDTTAITTGTYNAKSTPQRTPPKKRMFGSSGPGAEGLVAMERSYQEARRAERASKQNLCGHGAEAPASMERSHQESRRKEVTSGQTSPAAGAPPKQTIKQTIKQIAEQEQIDVQLMELVEDDFSDDGGLSPVIAKTDFTGAPHGCTSGERKLPPASIGQEGIGAGAHDDNIGDKAGDQAAGWAMASQETDYGGSEFDAAEEVLDFLEADTTWLDDDLDESL